VKQAKLYRENSAYYDRAINNKLKSCAGCTGCNGSGQAMYCETYRELGVLKFSRREAIIAETYAALHGERPIWEAMAL
jgi:hypothetical protein